MTPAAGATPGQATQISYVLPTTATVTLNIKSADGAAVQSLLAGVDQQAGSQQATWDGTDASGAVVPEGSYTISLSAKTTNGTTLTRYATARRSAAVAHSDSQ